MDALLALQQSTPTVPGRSKRRPETDLNGPGKRQRRRESDMQRPVWPRDDPLHRSPSAVPLKRALDFSLRETTVRSFPLHLTFPPSESNPP